ncbi:hypothetical protein GCM10010909_32510 [Acidocella aquatica]|uniref:Rieske domain-containing protein n=1 Tax=Acidocella aquatica TaxID=1922313 RepID=A0ABQ6AEV5_9PROT|nr:Rieske 2Fe-2S domain-containing protein [Acidocella aquatica]GLR68570.1 hypothetical protein GCM10010909_32510 [Acidocella aquatica]
MVAKILFDGTKKSALGEWHEAAASTDLAEGQGLQVQRGHDRIYLCRSQGFAHAVEDRCTHGEAAFSESGRVRSGFLLCLAHGARFDLASGRCLGAMRCPQLRRWRVLEENGAIFLGEEYPPG